ncbi:MAG: hypothetical protein IJ389_00430 [Clostridia bacterium]|nr:hypothetical protein [Clostridia bacterium]
MKKTSVSSLVSYLFPPIDNLLKSIIVLAAGIAVTLLENNLWVMAVFIALAVIEFIPDAAKIIRFFSAVSYLRSRKEMDEVLKDFADSTAKMDGKVRVGKKYIFGKKCGAVIAYDDIRRAHHFIRKNYGYSQKRFVEIFTLDGGKHKLCKVNANDTTLTEAQQLMELLKERAPKADVAVK